MKLHIPKKSCLNALHDLNTDTPFSTDYKKNIEEVLKIKYYLKIFLLQIDLRITNHLLECSTEVVARERTCCYINRFSSLV